MLYNTQTHRYNHKNTNQNPAGSILHNAVFYTIALKKCTDTIFKVEETTWRKSTIFSQTLITVYETTGCYASDDRNFRHLQGCEFQILHKIKYLYGVLETALFPTLHRNCICNTCTRKRPLTFEVSDVSHFMTMLQ